MVCFDFLAQVAIIGVAVAGAAIAFKLIGCVIACALIADVSQAVVLCNAIAVGIVAVAFNDLAILFNLGGLAIHFEGRLDSPSTCNLTQSLNTLPIRGDSPPDYLKK